MEEDLLHATKAYVEVIEKLGKTSDRMKVQALEEERVELHWIFIDKLKKYGISYRDREDATRIAYRIVNGEL